MAPVEASRSNNHPSIAQLIKEGVYAVGLSAGIGALAGYAFEIIHPVGGLVFGAASTLTIVIGRVILSRIDEDNVALKVATYVGTVIASIAAGVIAVTALGFPLTVGSFILLTLGMVVTGYAFPHILQASKCYSACIGGAVLAATT